MADPKPTTDKPRRLWRVVLIGSLALNLAIIGLVFGAGFSGRWKDGPPRGFDLALGPIAAALPREQRHEIRDRLRRSENFHPITPRDARADGARLLVALRAEVFDATAVQEMLTRQQGRVRELQAAAQSALVAQISEMTQQERAAFADRLEVEISRVRGPRP